MSIDRFCRWSDSCLCCKVFKKFFVDRDGGGGGLDRDGIFGYLECILFHLIKKKKNQYKE